MWELKGPKLKNTTMKAKDARALRLLRASGYRYISVNGGPWVSLKSKIEGD